MHPTESTFLPAADGTPLAVYDWPLAPAAAVRATVLIVHGMGEHAGRYAALAQRLNGWGMAVRAYDQYGHGRSGGPRGGLSSDGRLLDDLAQVLDATRAGMPASRPLVLLGHSMGGLVAARFVSMNLRPVDALVLSSPALAIPLSAVQKVLLNTVARLTPDLAVGNGLKPEWVCHNPATVAAYIADPLVHDRISGRLSHFLLDAGAVVRQRTAAWRTPTLIMWGEDDRCVDPAGSVAFATAAPAQWVTARPWPGLAHEIFNEVAQDQVLQTLSDWLAGVFAG